MVTIDQKRIKDPELFNYLMADMRSKITELELEEKAIKYGRYNGILELQDRHNNLNRKLVQGISESSSILSKIWQQMFLTGYDIHAFLILIFCFHFLVVITKLIWRFRYRIWTLGFSFKNFHFFNLYYALILVV